MSLLCVGGLRPASSTSEWVGNGARCHPYAFDMKRTRMVCPGCAGGVLKMPQEAWVGWRSEQHMKRALGLLAACVAAIVGAGWWRGRPIALPVGPADIGRLQCVSYAPFRPGQNPLEAGTHVPAAQIEEDLARLRQLTGCIRTYSIEHGV